MRFKVICLMIFSFLQVSGAWALEICGDLKQGELVLIKNIDAEKIIISEGEKDTKYNIGSDKSVLVALHRDAPQKNELHIYSSKAPEIIYDLNIMPVKWDVQRVNGVSQHKVSPQSVHQKEIEREREDVNKALSTYSNYNFWQEEFIEPIKGRRINGHFGYQRIFNGIPRNPHNGTDISAPEGTEVHASGSGKVILSGKDYFYTGNMIIIDHGAGLQTIYAHLQKSAVAVGDMVKKGDVIGYVGKTGRATGPHLHWGASLNGIRFRPHSLLNINKKGCKTLQDKDGGK